ncbi:MAG TPA: formate--tetrahydrofolate ligase [Longimicrobiales bacterium]
MTKVPTDIEIAEAAELRPIAEIAKKLGLGDADYEPYGRYKAKLPLSVIEERTAARAKKKKPAKLVLVAGINPTPAGEGKSTVSVGLADGLRQRGHEAVLALREPSLGPVFGVKGGATGGGYAQVVPMADINLHFTGDFHAITSAHALLAAMLDNHLFRPNTANIDPRRITWPRAVDMNDRALRKIVIGLGGRDGGMPREDGFVITAASEIMAILALSSNLEDLTRRISDIIVAYDRTGGLVRAGQLNAQGAMTLLLREAIMPNLVQTLEGTPALLHCGPFGNIAHGCNSILATRGALALGDVVVTEAGFGADLGAEKFFDIKCRTAGLSPDAAVVVGTVRALKLHGGVPLKELGTENPDAVKRGAENLIKHVENVRKFGVPVVVALNRFITDTDSELQAFRDAVMPTGAPVALTEVWAKGGAGALELADAVMDMIESTPSNFRPIYPLEAGFVQKIETIAREIYGADGVDFLPLAAKEIEQLEAAGLRDLAVCMAKTQYSFSDDPKKLGRPSGFRITVREVKPSAGAGFVVVKTGDIMTMPGLAAKPAAEGMGIDESGAIFGLA